MASVVEPYLDHAFVIPGQEPEWKWKHSDLAVRGWFLDSGYKLGFDVLHLIEWDLLLLDSAENLYRHIPANGVGLTALARVDSVEHNWFWTSTEPHRSEWCALLEWARSFHGFHEHPYCCLGPGYCLPRRFLEEYAALAPPSYCHDELRLPLMAQLLGFPLYDTNFCRNRTALAEHAFFNCEGDEVTLDTVQSEVAKLDGRRAFHPFRKVYSPSCATAVPPERPSHSGTPARRSAHLAKKLQA